MAEAGLEAVLLRRPDLPEEEYRDLAELVLHNLPPTCRLITHRWHLPCADGLHLPERLPLPETWVDGSSRSPHQLLGRSVHSAEAAAAAVREGCRYVLFGNVWVTATHPGRSAAGLHALARVCEHSSVPVIAIGGITPRRAAHCLQAGAAGVAAVSGLRTAADVALFLSALQLARSGACI
jgi:thiamine monophosphate synthase